MSASKQFSTGETEQLSQHEEPKDAAQPGGGNPGGAREPSRDSLGEGVWEQRHYSVRGKGAVLHRLGEEGTCPVGADALGR